MPIKMRESNESAEKLLVKKVRGRNDVEAFHVGLEFFKIVNVIRHNKAVMQGSRPGNQGIVLLLLRGSDFFDLACRSGSGTPKKISNYLRVFEPILRGWSQQSVSVHCPPRCVALEGRIVDVGGHQLVKNHRGKIDSRQNRQRNMPLDENISIQQRTLYRLRAFSFL